MILGGWRVSWWSVGVGVVGVGAGRGLRLGGRRFQACHSWLVVGRLVVLVVPVVSGVGVFPSTVLGSVVVGVAPVVVEGVDAVGGWRCHCVAAVREGAASRALGVGAAGDAEGEGVVGDVLVDGGVLTVGVGPRHSWHRFPWALLAGVLALAPLGVVDADGVVPGGVAVVAVVDALGCCCWGRTVGGAVGDAGCEVVAGVAMVFGVSDVADAAGGWCGSVCGWSVACVRGWALAGSSDSVWEGVQ